jgi:tetratricopeptide (TPR) repeat protein/tRNA A-37 threonylcarbamoyl transferase component Bud32
LIRAPFPRQALAVDESTVDDPSAPGPQGLDYDATSAAVLGGLFGTSERPRVGRYEVMRPLGSGAMGRVFAARDEALGRDVALKLLHVERGRDTRSRARFLREARALARVNHPNVVEVFEVGVHGDDVYIAMELLSGQTLREWMRSEDRPWRDTLKILLQVGEGLAAAHRVDLIHRDVKPANVWVGDDGRVRVIDFGLAMNEGDGLSETDRSDAALREALHAASSKLTRTGAMVGSPAYMAPEQLMQGRASEASDQFSFCVTAFEALHGERPYRGSTPIQLLEAMQRGSVARSEDDTPWWLDDVLARGLEARVQDRWRSMVDLVAALRRGPRRRWIPVAGVGVVVAALTGAWAWPTSALEGCDNHALAQWNARARKDLAARVGATDAVFERDIAGPLDGWTDAWSEQHRSTCEAGPEARAFDQTMHCLDLARERFSGAVAVLEDLEPGRVGEAVKVARGISAIPTCSGAVPDGEHDEVLLALTRTAALHDAGRFEEAHETATTALSSSDEASIRIELLYYAASALREQGRLDAAVSSAEQGYFLALKHGDDGNAVGLASLLVSSLGGMAELDAAQRWYDIGMGLVERTADPTAMQGKLDTALGLALYSAGKPAMAVEVYERAIEAVPSDRQTQLAALEGDRGNALLDTGRLDEGREALRRSLTALQATYGPDHPKVATANTNLGVAYAMGGRFDEARPYFAEALRIARQTETDAHALGMALGNMGLVEHSDGRYEEARPYLEQALEQFETLGDPSSPRVLSTLNNLAVNAQARGDLEAAERQLWSMLERNREKYGPEHIDLGRNHNALGDNFILRARFVEAQAQFREALRIFENALGSEHPDVAYPLIGLGRCASKLEHHEEAQELLRRAIQLTAADGVDPSLLHEARLELGRALLAAPGSGQDARAVLEAARAAAVARESEDAIEEIEAVLAG